MSNQLNPDLFKQWKQIIEECNKALDSHDIVAFELWQGRFNAFATNNQIDISMPVTEGSGAPPPTPDPTVDKNSEAYKSGFKHGQEDAKITDESKRYTNQPEKGPSFHSNNFNAGYKDGFGGGSGPGPVTPPGPTGDGNVDENGQLMIYPSKQGGKVITKHDTRYFTRHYASGKPDEPTVEMHIDSGQPMINQECTAVVTMTGMSHPDTMDWKMYTGEHTSKNGGISGTCYDLELMTDGSGSKTLEVESPHPHNHAAHQPQLFKPGDISNKKIGWKGICINTEDGKGVHIESWINLTPDDQSGWKKYIDVTDTGQLYKPTSPILKPFGSLAIIRIDGIKGKPLFDKVSMREITWPSSSSSSAKHERSDLSKAMDDDKPISTKNSTFERNKPTVELEESTALTRTNTKTMKTDTMI